MCAIGSHLDEALVRSFMYGPEAKSSLAMDPCSRPAAMDCRHICRFFFSLAALSSDLDQRGVVDRHLRTVELLIARRGRAGDVDAHRAPGHTLQLSSGLSPYFNNN